MAREMPGGVLSVLNAGREAARVLGRWERAPLAASSGWVARADLDSALQGDLHAAAELVDRISDGTEMRFALYEHYVEGRTWKEIASMLKRSERVMYDIRRRAIRHAEELVGDGGGPGRTVC